MVNQPEEIDPAEELEERREVAPGAEISGNILPSQLAMPEGLGPEWSPLLSSMREEMGAEIADVMRELLGEGRPEPLIGFAQGPADAAGTAVANFGYVPLATVWEITNLFARHTEGGDETATVHLEPGGQIDALTVPTLVGASATWAGPLYLRSGTRLAVHAEGLTATTGYLEVAITGRIHSTRNT